MVVVMTVARKPKTGTQTLGVQEKKKKKKKKKKKTVIPRMTLRLFHKKQTWPVTRRHLGSMLMAI